MTTMTTVNATEALDLAAFATLTPEQQAHVVEAAVTSVVGEATMLRSRAIAKQQEAIALLRQADQAEHVRALRQQLDAAEAWLADAAGQVDDHAAAVEDLRRAERAAHDRLRDAEENLRRAREAHELLVFEEASAAKLTESLLRVNAAREVLDSLRPTAERGTADREAGERATAAAREVVRQGREALKGARAEVKRAETTPDAAPRSAATVLLGWQQLVAEGADRLTQTELETVRGVVEALATLVGLDRVLVAKGRQGAIKEYLEGKGHEMRAALNPPSQTFVVPGGGAR